MSNELTKPNKITVGGLHNRLRQAEVLKEAVPTLDPRNLPNRLAVICDFSGSMGDRASGRWDTDNLKTKLQLLQEAVQDFALRSNPADTALAVESFPRGFRIELTNDTQSVDMRMLGISTLGDTPMGEGLSSALEDHSQPERCLFQMVNKPMERVVLSKLRNIRTVKSTSIVYILEAVRKGKRR